MQRSNTNDACLRGGVPFFILAGLTVARQCQDQFVRRDFPRANGRCTTLTLSLRAHGCGQIGRRKKIRTGPHRREQLIADLCHFRDKFAVLFVNSSPWRSKAFQGVAEPLQARIAPLSFSNMFGHQIADGLRLPFRANELQTIKYEVISPTPLT